MLSPNRNRPGAKRPGTTALECAVVLPILMLLLIGLIVAGLGVFRYQEVAALAREGARYASVRGAKYQLTTGKTAATKESVYQNAILPRVTGMKTANLKYDVTWSPDNQQGSQVTVTVSYRWIPEAFFGGMDLSSTSTVAVAY